MTTLNKRKHVRIDSLNLSNVYLCEDEKPIDQSMGRTLNISESGILLETSLPIDLNGKLSMEIALEDEVIELKGTVIHAKETEDGKHEIGISFDSPDHSTGEILKRFIQNLNAPQTPRVDF